MEKNSIAAVSIRPARKGDDVAIQCLLRLAELPSEDVSEHLETFLVAVVGGEIVGTVGLEVTGSSGLLRSLAVAVPLRGIGLGKLLYGEIVEKARSLGIQRLGLLTTTAEGFFARVGFEKEKRSDIPPFIALSKEYKIYCPSTAVIMTKTIG